MKYAVAVLVLLMFATPPQGSQTSQDEDALRHLPQSFCEAWAKHDGHALAQIMAEDVDFVTVAGVYLRGRADFEKFHTRLMNGRFKNSTNTPVQTTVRFLNPDLAVVHWSWRIEGDRNFDGSPRQPRFGLMTMVAAKRNDKWLVVVAQNTNAVLGVPPELEGIETPIPVPGTEPKRP
jgi:uncharacterized protein (TIGR02246 family)